jgi:hypothetical protein
MRIIRFAHEIASLSYKSAPALLAGFVSLAEFAAWRNLQFRHKEPRICNTIV